MEVQMGEQLYVQCCKCFPCSKEHQPKSTEQILLQKYPSYFYGPCNFEEFNLNSAAKNKTQGLLPCFLKQLKIQTSRTFRKSSKYFSFLAR